MGSVSTDADSEGRRHWLWVARPDDANLYYLENDPDGTNSWTAHRDTREGDLALVYLTGPVQSIGHLVEVVSDAYLSDWNGAAAWVSDYRRLLRVPVAITLGEMHSDRVLSQHFGAMGARFRQRVYELPPTVWNRLVDMLRARNPGLGPQFKAHAGSGRSKPALLEYRIEDALESNIEVLGSRLKLNLSIYDRQYRCGPYGRIDLLCRYTRGWVVVEVKRDRAMASAVGQIAAYMAYVRENLRTASRPNVRGVLVARGADPRFEAARSEVDRLDFVDLNDISSGLGLSSNR